MGDMPNWNRFLRSVLSGKDKLHKDHKQQDSNSNKRGEADEHNKA